MGIVVDSPIGRALARRLEGPQETPPDVAELAKKVELLEAEVDDLTRSVQSAPGRERVPPAPAGRPVVAGPPCRRHRPSLTAAAPRRPGRR